MKARLIKVLAIAAFMLIAASPAAQADVGMKGDLGLGGHVLLGGATALDGSFGFGIEPYISYNPIDNLSIFGRLPFWEGYFASNMEWHVFPFMFGARYYFEVMDKLRVYPGLAIGMAINHFTFNINPGFGIGNVSGSSTEADFAMDIQGGVEYEVIDNLAIDGSFDIFMPNLSDGKDTEARFGVMAGVIYYLPI